MKTRTSMAIMNNGTVKCFCGSIEDFAKDMCDFIQPLLNYLITVDFNNTEFIVTTYDNVETICEKYKYEIQRKMKC